MKDERMTEPEMTRLKRFVALEKVEVYFWMFGSDTVMSILSKRYHF